MSSLSHFSIGWICAIDTEIIAAELMFDETLSAPESIPESDVNSYSFGRISGHSVVVACLPQCQYGISNATAAVKDMLRSFPIKTVVMVGIAGGAPNLDNGVDIRLGDVVVSSPGINNGGVLQYGYGKKHQDDNDPLRFETTGHLNQPPLSMLNAVNQLKARYRMEGHRIQHTISEAFRRRPELKPKLKRELRRPGRKTDRLYQSNVIHVDGYKTCHSCGDDDSTVVQRVVRDPEDDDPVIHHGLLASADSLMKDAIMRDRLSRERGVLCFEMEAAGLMNHVPCIAIRGICDYSDSHKNKVWQGYAAMTAASYTKELLASIKPNQMAAEERLIEKIEAGFSNVGNQLHDLNVQLSSVEDSVRRNKITAWLSPPDPSTNFSRARRQYQPGTGKWFLDSREYAAWKVERNSFLWLNGIPGCGKTILSSSVIEGLKRIAEPTHDILYFYFDFNDVEKQSLGKCVRSLLHQLCRKREDVRKELDILYSSPNNAGSPSDDEPLYTVLENILKNGGEYWIIIDALDECHARNDDPVHRLLPWLKHIRDMDFNIHLMVTSRPEQDIASSINEWALDRDVVALQNSLVADDILAYIQTKTMQMHRWQERLDIREHIENVLSKKANGMFRWVSCQIDVLEECLDWPSVKRELNNLPQTLDATYERILQNMKESYRPATTRLLQFLTYMKRPLRLEEAVDIVAVDTSQKPRFDVADRVQIPDEVLRYCSSLVIMTLIDNKEDQTIIKEIQLAHFSVQEYLMSSRPKGYLTTDLEKPNASAAILDTCLSYLLDIDHPDDRKQAKNKYPLAEYSAHFWIDYAIIAEQSTNQALPSVVEYLSSDRFQSIQVLYFADLESVVAIPPSLSWASHFDKTDRVDGLYCASHGGLFHAAQALLKGGKNANASWGGLRNGWHGWDSALCAASNLNHANIVQILLDHGANVNDQWPRFGNALCAASGANNANVVQILLDHGAIMHTHTEDENALQTACRFGATESVRVLLCQGKDIDVPNKRGTPLRVALEWGDAEIARMLLDRGACFNPEWYTGHNNLVSVLAKAHTGIIRLLLEQGVDFTAEDPDLGTPLYLASSKGYTEVVQILLDYGAGSKLLTNANAQDGIKCFNPIQAAARSGFKDIVRILLSHGIDVNTRAGHGPTALHDASSRGHTEIVRMLLHHGAAADAIVKVFLDSVKSEFEDRAIHAASFRGHAEIVRILLDHGADIHALDSDGLSALYKASAGGKLAVVQLLLDYGAAANVTAKFPCNPSRFALENRALHAASSEGHAEIVRILLDHGADIYALNSRGSSALHAASAGGKLAVVQLLLDRGAADKDDLVLENILDKKYQFPAYVDIVKALLDHKISRTERIGDESRPRKRPKISDTM